MANRPSRFEGIPPPRKNVSEKRKVIFAYFKDILTFDEN
jgi:hypothetical protein